MNLADKEIRIVEALAVCAELTGTQLSDAAMNAMVEDLLAYDTGTVLAALNRCRRELTGRLTLAAILQRLDTGLPSADEAFGLLAEGWRNEALTVVVPEIAMQAAGMGAFGLFQAGDKTGARMAFREAYVRLAADVREARWTVSAGSDREQRTRAVEAAVRDGRLDAHRAAAYLPSEAAEARLRLENRPLLPHEIEAGRAYSARLLALLADKIGRMQ